MEYKYKITMFVPSVNDYQSVDNNWDNEESPQFQRFLNIHEQQGWRLYSRELRPVNVDEENQDLNAICLVCIFEKQKNQNK